MCYWISVTSFLSYLPLEQPLVCRHLKVVEIKCKEVDRRIQQLLDILSTYGMPLEQVNIQRTNRASGPWCESNYWNLCFSYFCNMPICVFIWRQRLPILDELNKWMSKVCIIFLSNIYEVWKYLYRLHIGSSESIVHWWKLSIFEASFTILWLCLHFHFVQVPLNFQVQNKETWVIDGSTSVPNHNIGATL
jgi:hypothetical protein